MYAALELVYADAYIHNFNGVDNNYNVDVLARPLYRIPAGSRNDTHIGNSQRVVALREAVNEDHQAHDIPQGRGSRILVDAF